MEQRGLSPAQFVEYLNPTQYHRALEPRRIEVNMAISFANDFIVAQYRVWCTQRYGKLWEAEWKTRTSS